ncbi:ficolin-1-like isoform X2 [Drosophila hydei]|uniref:Ficolin-1-like isoform X2 n=1 Tax=Drosophila hydei TaxID=7224 RepID=A0A6J2ST44_DROHY|nr:ficolin-1-like isoform X2 [Drosophila hydei]
MGSKRLRNYIDDIVRHLQQPLISLQAEIIQMQQLKESFKHFLDSLTISNIEKANIQFTTETEMSQNITNSCLGKSTGIYKIKVPGLNPFPVSCDSTLITSGWTVIQRRIDGSVSFNRKWEVYRSGFGNLNGDFFLGLEKIHLLTISQKHELYIYLKDFNGEDRYARYSHFLVGPNEDNFKLISLGDYSGNGGDSMAAHLHMEFSTPDADHDNHKSLHCAEWITAGWWYNSCTQSDLNGLYKLPESESQTFGINWFTWHAKTLKFVQMMIRPV